LQRTIETAHELPYSKLTWKSLDELDAGVCDGMTYEEIEVTSSFGRGKANIPIPIISRQHTLRIMQTGMRTNSIIDIVVSGCAEAWYSCNEIGGESYRDVVVRLEPVIMELERQENILIIGHQVCYPFYLVSVC
jgi:6-phosphofructo-2-kinase / fructose-2,6-biphosphatase 2